MKNFLAKLNLNLILILILVSLNEISVKKQHDEQQKVEQKLWTIKLNKKMDNKLKVKLSQAINGFEL